LILEIKLVGEILKNVTEHHVSIMFKLIFYKLKIHI